MQFTACSSPIRSILSWYTDIENPESLQTMLADIFVGNCGHFDETQWIYTKMSNYGQIQKQYVTYTVYLGRNLIICCNFKLCEVMICLVILSDTHLACGPNFFQDFKLKTHCD